MTDTIRALESRLARLEEEKAQVEQSLTIYKQEYAARCDDLEHAEAREAVLREALAKCYRQLKDQQAMPDDTNDAYYAAALSSPLAAPRSE